MVQKLVKFNNFNVNEFNGISFTSLNRFKRFKKDISKHKKNVLYFNSFVIFFFLHSPTYEYEIIL